MKLEETYQFLLNSIIEISNGTSAEKENMKSEHPSTADFFKATNIALNKKVLTKEGIKNVLRMKGPGVYNTNADYICRGAALQNEQEGWGLRIASTEGIGDIIKEFVD